MGKESAFNAGDWGSIPGSGRSPGGGHGNPRQCSCLENPTDRGAWRAAVHRVAELDTTEQLSTHVVSQSCLTLCHPIDCSRQVPLSIELRRQKSWSGLPFPTPEDLPNPGTEPMSFVSLALADRFFTTSATWKDSFYRGG